MVIKVPLHGSDQTPSKVSCVYVCMYVCMVLGVRSLYKSDVHGACAWAVITIFKVSVKLSIFFLSSAICVVQVFFQCW